MAPSGVNLQPWYFVVLETPEAIARYKDFMRKTAEGFRPILEERFPNHPNVVESTSAFLGNNGGAPVVVLVFLHKPELNDEGEGNPNTQGVAAAIENLLLLAWDKGIGSCWLTSPVLAGLSREIEAEFAPGKGHLVATIPMGYPAETPKAPKRKTDRYEFL